MNTQTGGITLYIDIILVENIIMNYIILLATGVITKVKMKPIRMLCSCIVGGMYVVMTYVSNFSMYQHQSTKIMLALTMIYIAFHPGNVKKLLQEVIIFYLTSFCFGGAAYYLLYYINSEKNNRYGEMTIEAYPVKIALLGGILGFFLITLAFKLIKNRFDRNSILYSVELVYEGKSSVLKAILDTGNLLVEPITSLPVVVVEAEKLKKIMTQETMDTLLNIVEKTPMEEIDERLKARCRLIPFSSLGKEKGMLVGVKPDYIKIWDDEKEYMIKDVIIGIYPRKLSRNGTYAGLFGLELLQERNGVQYEYY